MKRLIVSKRGAESISIPNIAQSVLAILFFTVFFLFAHQAIAGRTVYEEIFAKKIVLIMDNAKPGSVFYLDISDALDIARKEKYDCSEGKCFMLNEEEKTLRISFGSGGFPYTYRYFSDYNFTLDINTQPNVEILTIRVEDKR